MNFTCPCCGNNAFVVAQDSDGASLATCGKCAKSFHLRNTMMTNSPAVREPGTAGETEPNDLQ
jgi:transcription elongation factor Elf1